jgi:hypothetical protein
MLMQSPAVGAVRLRGGTSGSYGDYDKTNLPDPLILTNYFSVRDEKIVSLIKIHNKPSEY